nr:unnamed protein product [Spirometra erinaceieuropaei]
MEAEENNQLAFLDVLVCRKECVNRTNATIASLVVTFIVGIPSAVDLRILTNQDFVWGFALMISGLCYCFLVIRYDPLRYRKIIVNDFGIGDLKLPVTWVAFITVLVPIEAVSLICWWAYESITQNPDWYKFHAESFVVIMMEWLVLLLLLGGLNWFVYMRNIQIFEKSLELGYDPLHPEMIPPKETEHFDKRISVTPQDCILS